jgi:hypothetical protein
MRTENKPMADKYEDRRTAKAAAYRSADNPFELGTRLHRYFIKAREHHDKMEVAFRDLEHVYGTIGTPRMQRYWSHAAVRPD